jgi:(4S)-4-hydroxy-5-phosphonooxypentane-2,3-dione isomerase
MSYVLQVQITIKPENVDKFMPKVLQNAAAARKEPGCRTFDVNVDPADRTKVMLYEIYKDEAAFQEHQKGEAFKKYLAEAVPLLASRERKFWTRAN